MSWGIGAITDESFADRRSTGGMMERRSLQRLESHARASKAILELCPAPCYRSFNFEASITLVPSVEKRCQRVATRG